MNLLAEDNHRVGHFDAAHNMVTPLDKNPPRRDPLIDGGTNHLPLKNSLNSHPRPRPKQKQRKQQASPTCADTTRQAQAHTLCLMRDLPGTFSLVVVLQSQVRDERLASQVPQRVFEFHQLNEQVVLGVESRSGHRRFQIEA
jgi:hypothetical protein